MVYTTKNSLHILGIHGISQNPDTKDYIIVLQYIQGGNFNNWMNENFKSFNWKNKLMALSNIISGLKEIHQKRMIHRDFHTGNILVKRADHQVISDMGLCGKVGNMDKTKIYGVMPYVAPEVLKGKPYNQAADIYSLGMIMYFIATGRQPFDNCAHDKYLALNICNEVRPEISEPEAPKCYIDLMKKCWDPNPDNRPNTTKIQNSVRLFRYSYIYDASDFEKYMLIKKEQQHYEIENQFKEAEEYRKANLLSNENNHLTTHPQAIYTSRLLNPFTEDLPKEHDNIDNSSVEITDFTK